MRCAPACSNDGHVSSGQQGMIAPKPAIVAHLQHASRLLRAAAVVCLLSSTVGCATSSTIEASTAPPGGTVALRVQVCVDRTRTTDRDLSADATAAFVEALNQSHEFSVDPQAPYELTCDVSNFLEGSAVRRWLMPGWGATVGQIAAMITDSRTGETVLIVRGSATVNSGGLYTIGADTYILRTAVNDAVRQMATWAHGEPAAARLENPAFPVKAFQ